MSRSTAHVPQTRGSFTTVAAFLFGMPIGIGLLVFCHYGPYSDADWVDYVKHPVEMTEVVMFCCAVAAMLAKIIGSWSERSARRSEILPPWTGAPVPVADAGPLRGQ